MFICIYQKNQNLVNFQENILLQQKITIFKDPVTMEIHPNPCQEHEKKPKPTLLPSCESQISREIFQDFFLSLTRKC